MWFATEGGVSSYDGVSFRNISVENGLPSAYTELVTGARDGSLWIGTRTGLVRYDGTSLKTLVDAKPRWANELDRHGNIWYGDAGAIYVSTARSKPSTAKACPARRCYSVTPIGNSEFIGRRETGAVELLVDNTKLLGIRRYRPADGLAHPTVRAIVRDREGRTYFGTRGGGVTRFDGKSFTTFDTRHGLPSNDVYAMHITRRGQLVAGTLDNGLAICDLPDFQRCRHINTSTAARRSVFSIFEDREGNSDRSPTGQQADVAARGELHRAEDCPGRVLLRATG
jgi:ligand-binding sensor domain-containing protein